MLRASNQQSSSASKLYLAVLVILGWLALAAQFYIITNNRVTSVLEMTVRYFSFFTIEVNLLLAVCFTVLLFGPASTWGAFFAKQQTLAALTVYIFIVGLIYNIILRFQWNPQGFQRVVDELLHAVIPVLALVYWLVFINKNQLQWKNVWPWLIYPLVYILYSLVRGVFAKWYPYPFVNVDQLGITKVLINSVGVAIIFILVSLGVIAIGRFTNKTAL